jgi:hypothetical protein
MTAIACAKGYPVPREYVPDPALQRASMANLQARASKGCVVMQTRDALTQDDKEVRRKCDCYASATLKSFTPTEVQFYRDNGYFDDSGREKGFKALDACGLKRP